MKQETVKAIADHIQDWSRSDPHVMGDVLTLLTRMAESAETHRERKLAAEFDQLRSELKDRISQVEDES